MRSFGGFLQLIRDYLMAFPSAASTGPFGAAVTQNPKRDFSMWAGIAMVAALAAHAYVTQIGVAQELIAQEKLRLSDPPTNRLASQLHQFACGMHQ
jgi:hypothetical protein